MEGSRVGKTDAVFLLREGAASCVAAAGADTVAVEEVDTAGAAEYLLNGVMSWSSRYCSRLESYEGSLLFEWAMSDEG